VFVARNCAWLLIADDHKRWLLVAMSELLVRLTTAQLHGGKPGSEQNHFLHLAARHKHGRKAIRVHHGFNRNEKGRGTQACQPPMDTD
jgi:hypothetical protein